MAPDDEWWITIAHAFSAHVREERYVLERYEELAATTADPGTRFLLELILEDERRHHELFERLGASATGGPEGAAVPGPPEPEAEHATALLEQTTRFLEIERDDAAGLKRLGRELKPGAHDTMWRLLVEVMELDTEKHIRILEYLRHRLEHPGR
jgi:rubrerythrin